MFYALPIIAHLGCARDDALAQLKSATMRADAAEARLQRLEYAIDNDLGGEVLGGAVDAVDAAATRLKNMTSQLAQSRSEVEDARALRKEIADVLGDDADADPAALSKRVKATVKEAQALETVRALLRPATKKTSTFADYLHEHATDPDRLRSYLGMPASGKASSDSEA